MVELVRATTSDGLFLDGALSVSSSVAGCGLDAVILLHGVGGNFYSGSLFPELLPGLLKMGLACLRVNTRGHGTISMIASQAGPVRQGAAMEQVGDCRYDLAAWADFLQERGFRRIVLLGHSLGAIKAIYSCSVNPHPAVWRVVAASPPRLSHQAFSAAGAPGYSESLAIARRLVADGQADQLFQSRFPFPMLISAASYIDKYGPGERYNILKHLPAVGVPVLVIHGELELAEGGVAFAGLPEAIQAAVGPRGGVETRMVPGADHFYTNRQAALGELVTRWLAQPAGSDA